MGNFASKLFSTHGESDSTFKLQSHNRSGSVEKHQCTPIMTRRSLSADPRSATIGIVRTPIEVDSTPTGDSKRTASAIPKYLQMKPYLETDIDSVMTALTPERCIPDPRSPNITCERTPIIVKSVSEYGSPPVNLDKSADIQGEDNSTTGLDPRSPAINFDRTPIMKPKSPGNNEKMSHDHIAKLDTEPAMLYCETTIDYIIPEVQALPEIISYQPSSFEKRLEACDSTLNDTSLECPTNTDISLEESYSEEQITIIPNLNALMDQSQLLNTLDTIDQEVKNDLVDVNSCNSIDTLSKLMANSGEEIENINGKIRVWRDSISPTFLPESRVEVFKTPEEIIIEFDDEQTIVKPCSKSGIIMEISGEKTMDSGLITGKKKMQHSNKDIKMIYEDAKEYNGTVVIDTQKNRTPLGNRSNNHKSGLLTKSPQQVLRTKNMSVKLQQENTPPRSKRGKSRNKLNPTQWDLDRTVVI